MAKFDKTYLSLDQAEDRGFIHRDYIAHCLRWSHVIKRLQERQAYKTANILDIGCGKEIPMAKMLYSSRMSPSSYIGLDIGKIEKPVFFDKMGTKFPLFLYDKTNFLTYSHIMPWKITHIICLELLEHMQKADGLILLDKVKMQMELSNNAVFFLSTPCYNGSQANNHLYEWKYEELLDELMKRFKLVDHWGTFASIKDYEDKMTGTLRTVFELLRGYYDVNYLATIFAPLFPAQSRNCLWELTL